MGARTSGANTSPFSSKNLPKADYTIPKRDIDRMKKVTSPIVKANKLHLITKAYKSFAIDKGIDVGELCKKNKLKPKELYHKLGYFDELVEYISKIEI